MPHKYRHLLAGKAALCRGFVRQRQVTRHANYAGQLVCMAQANHQRHGATLGKSSHYDSLGRHAACDFMRNQHLDIGLRLAQAGLVLTPTQVGCHDVIPGRHGHAAIDRHRYDRCIGEQKPHRADAGQIELFGDRQEVLPIRPQPVHDKNGRNRLFAGLGFDNLKGHDQGFPEVWKKPGFYGRVKTALQLH